MNTKWFLGAGLIVLVLAMPSSAAAPPPNIVLILADDLGWSDLAADQLQRAAEMRKLLAEWRRSVDAQMPTVNPNPVDPFGPGAVDRPQAKKAKRKAQASGKPGA